MRPNPATTASPPTGAHADRDLVLDAGRVEEVTVQLAVGERSALDELRQPQSRAPSGCVRGQQRMVSRAPDERLEGAGGLRLGRDRLVANGARGELDPVPRQNVGGDEVGERSQRAKTQLSLRPGSGHRQGNSVRGARVKARAAGLLIAFERGRPIIVDRHALPRPRQGRDQAHSRRARSEGRDGRSGDEDRPVPVRTPADPVTVANVSSRRVAERCGYLRDGVMRLVHLKDDRIDAALCSWLPSGPA